ncbi:hypothetical protein H9L39_06098 [Fusarium oxysporum f. sp. albedinis]|nr:hypothetical protein FOMA001_g5836 [Fusarium oxysporum f. sp. matthiolae]KAK2484306.1 hypothetical protein H9L39_06098 [Fusarium oxysporum f. sp. albedinis]
MPGKANNSSSLRVEVSPTSPLPYNGCALNGKSNDLCTGCELIAIRADLSRTGAADAGVGRRDAR